MIRLSPAAARVVILRPALPVAALGMRVTCVFPVGVAGHHARVAKWFGDQFACRSELRVLGAAPRCVFAGRRDALVVLTGSPETARAVRMELNGDLLAATGRCAVTVGPREAAVRRFYAESRKRRVRHSCTNVRAAFVVSRRRHGAPGYAGFTGPCRKQRQFEAAPRLLHPSVVLTLPGAASGLPLDKDRRVAGYQCLPCGEHGDVQDLKGFGADPVWGWPEDYLA
jgi:hypothetical protein